MVDAQPQPLLLTFTAPELAPLDAPEPVGPLVSLAELRVWTRAEIADDDQFASEMLVAASDLVRAVARQPGWTAASVPSRAKQICAHLASRTYLNPDSVVREGNIGPLGGDSRVESVSIALHLTEAERTELTSAPLVGGSTGARGGLWVQPVNSTPVTGGDVYLADDSGSDWHIPYLAEDDIQALG